MSERNTINILLYIVILSANGIPYTLHHAQFLWLTFLFLYVEASADYIKTPEKQRTPDF